MSKTTIHSFVPIQKLGEGTFSSVYKVRRISDNKIYALKKIKMASLKEKEKVNALNEIRILASLCSQHIVTYKQAFFDEELKLLCIVMQCANQGDLLQKINKAKSANTFIEEREIWKAIYQILMGLLTLHKHSILHRDLKSANIFVNDSNYKIGDLNVSKINADQKLVKTQTGTPYYASPQIWRDEPYDHKSDIWSFGCIIFEMCCLQPPFQGNSLDELYKNIQKGFFPKIPDRYSPQLMSIITQCLSLKAEKRPNAEDLLTVGGVVRCKCQFYQIKTDTNRNVGKKQPLLSTIKMPYDINNLNTKLPHAKYDTEDKKSNSLPAKSNNIQKSTEIKQAKMESNNGSKLIDQSKNKQANVTKQKQNLAPLPQRIKNHLKDMAERNSSDVIAHRRPKARIQTALIRPHNNLLPHQLPNFSNIIPAVSNNKRRPFSCDLKNRINPKPVNSTRPFTALQQRNKKVVSNIQQQKRQLVYLQKQRAQQRRKIPTQHSYLGYNYKGPISKERCRSAVLRNDSSVSKQPVSSSYAEIRKRLQSRQKQMHSSQHYSALKNNSYVNKPQQKQNEARYREVSAQKLPPLITKQVYLRNAKPNLQQSSFLKENRSYLMEIQNKLLGTSSKAKKCPYMLNSQVPHVEQTKLKQLLKQQHIFQGKYNM